MDTTEAVTFWVLIVAFALSAVYELWRAVARAGVSEHDSMGRFIREQLAFIVVSFTVAGLVTTGEAWALWIVVGLTAFILVYSIAYYQPSVLPARNPGVFDQVESVVFIGLVSVALAMAVLGLADVRLQA